MKDMLDKNTLREAGRRLIEVGENLVDGKIDKVLVQMERDQFYPAWEQLIKAKSDIENAIRERDNAIEIKHMLVEVITSILNSVFRFRLP